MKKIIVLLLIISVMLTGCTDSNTIKDSTADYTNSASAGVWLSFSEINTMLKSEKGFKAEFETLLDNCKSLNITELYVHIRSYCDSLFKSDYFPLIAAAENSDYDIFKYITEECHSVGIKVHAWINPYRVLTSSDDVNALNTESPAYKWLNDDKSENDINVIRYNGIYLNPAEYEVRELVINGIREVLNKYEVDGIHFDDYFYPTADPDFDAASYKKYTESTDNPLPLDEWRRSNVNALISGVYTAVKFYGKEILFTVSPMAAIDKNYSELFADVRAWIENGCVDSIIPQLYFGYDYPDESFRFENLLNDWIRLADCNKNVKLIIGLAPYKIGTDTPADREEWCNTTDIIARQANECYTNSRVAGYALFSYSSLFSENELNALQRDNLKKFIEE